MYLDNGIMYADVTSYDLVIYYVIIVEIYSKVRSSSVYMIGYDIGHKKMGSCKNLVLQCIICSGPHKIKKHYCGLASWIKKKVKI